MSFDDVRMKGFSKNMKVAEAINLAIDKLQFLPIEILSLRESDIRNYVLREDIHA